MYFDTLASTSPVVEHLAQVKNLRHIQQAASRLLLLYFALQEDDMRLHRQDLFENSASESITSAHDKLDGPLPQKSELLEPTVVYTKIAVSRRRSYTPSCCISPGNIQNCCISPEVTPRQNCARITLNFGKSLGLSNRHDGQGSRDTMPNSGDGSLWQNYGQSTDMCPYPP